MQALQSEEFHPNKGFNLNKTSPKISVLINTSRRIFWNFAQSNFPHACKGSFTERTCNKAIAHIFWEEKHKKRDGAPYHLFKNVLHLYVLTEKFKRSLDSVKLLLSNHTLFNSRANLSRKDYCQKTEKAREALNDLIAYLNMIKNNAIFSKEFNALLDITAEDVQEILEHPSKPSLDEIKSISYQLRPLASYPTCQSFIGAVTRNILENRDIGIIGLDVDLLSYFGVKYDKATAAAAEANQMLAEQMIPLQHQVEIQTHTLANGEAERRQLYETIALLRQQLDDAHKDMAAQREQTVRATINTANTLLEEQRRRNRAQQAPRRVLPEGGPNVGPRPNQGQNGK